MIHEGFNKPTVAVRYYAKLGRQYTREAARKQLIQDNNIDEKILLQVLKDIYKEATK